MRQVPVRPHSNSSASARLARVERYLIVGSGRVATHLLHYFTLENLNVNQWRRADAVLDSVISDADVVLLAISDSAIERFFSEHPALATKTCVHFSGALSFPKIIGAHPLMTFRDELYDLETYRKIPFVMEKERAETFGDLFPALQNPHFAIALEKKSLYHALCVLSGNFTVMLWEKTFAEFEKNLELPREALIPYMSRVFENLKPRGPSVLTGPLVRGDRATIDQHLKVLSDDPYRGVYEAFVAAYSETHKGARP